MSVRIIIGVEINGIVQENSTEVYTDSPVFYDCFTDI